MIRGNRHIPLELALLNKKEKLMHEKTPDILTWSFSDVCPAAESSRPVQESDVAAGDKSLLTTQAKPEASSTLLVASSYVLASLTRHARGGLRSYLAPRQGVTQLAMSKPALRNHLSTQSHEATNI